MTDVPAHLRRFLPERREPTPEERLAAYRAAHPVPHRTVSPASGSPAEWRWPWIKLALAAGALVVVIGRNVIG